VGCVRYVVCVLKVVVSMGADELRGRGIWWYASEWCGGEWEL